MRITDHELRSVLSAHARRISRASASKRRVSTAGGDESTQLTLSIEARRRQLVDRITGDIVAGLGQRRRRLDRSIDDPRDLALDRLSLEYGQSLYLEDTVRSAPFQRKRSRGRRRTSSFAREGTDRITVALGRLGRAGQHQPCSVNLGPCRLRSCGSLYLLANHMPRHGSFRVDAGHAGR